MKIKFDFIFLIAILLGSPALAYSSEAFNLWAPPNNIQEDKEIDELLSLDLEDLLVTVASKKEEKIRNAPGIITVVTAEEIKKYGYTNLRDILDRQTSLLISGAHVYKIGRSNLRGVSQGIVDDSILILLNGRPIREAGSTGFNYDIYSGFPVEAIKQIELIRGPGSVIYGTNAMAGVINIVTKKNHDQLEVSSSLSYGSYGRKQLTLNGGGPLGPVQFYSAINLLDDEDNVSFPGFRTESGQPGPYPFGAKNYQGVVTAQWKGLKVNGYFSKLDTSIFPIQVINSPITPFGIRRAYIDIGYVKPKRRLVYFC